MLGTCRYVATNVKSSINSPSEKASGNQVGPLRSYHECPPGGVLARALLSVFRNMGSQGSQEACWRHPLWRSSQSILDYLCFGAEVHNSREAPFHTPRNPFLSGTPHFKAPWYLDSIKCGFTLKIKTKTKPSLRVCTHFLSQHSTAKHRLHCQEL